MRCIILRFYQKCGLFNVVIFDIKKEQQRNLMNVMFLIIRKCMKQTLLNSFSIANHNRLILISCKSYFSKNIMKFLENENSKSDFFSVQVRRQLVTALRIDLMSKDCENNIHKS